MLDLTTIRTLALFFVYFRKTNGACNLWFEYFMRPAMLDIPVSTVSLGSATDVFRKRPVGYQHDASDAVHDGKVHIVLNLAV